jgi:predicted NBD/HSP70 family sugar kinase
VIIGGGIARAGTTLLEPLEVRIRELVPVAPRVALSALGDQAVALGAARLGLQTVEDRLFAVAAIGAA